MESSYWKRLGIFFDERFPLFLGGLTTLVGTLSSYLIWVAVTDGAAFVFNQSLVLAFFSFFCLTIILRLCDEFKDKEVDKVLFPERCLPKGLVKYEDIEKLLYAIALVWVPVNYIFGQADMAFTILMIYVYLFYKYFFFPRQISNNLMLALFTHNPIMLVGSFYIVSLFSVEQGLDVWTLKNFMLALAFWMPSLAWETSRKIRAPQDENDYVTYSKVLGPQWACLLPIGAAFTQMAALVNVVKDLQYGMHFLLGNVTLFFLYFMVFLVFMVKLRSSIANKLRQTTEAYILCTSLLIILISIIEIIK